MLETLLTLDGALLLWLQDLRTPILNALFSFYTQLGNAGLVWIVLSAVLLLHPRTRKAGFWALIAMLFGLLFTNVLLKHLVARTRPWLVVEGLTALVEERDPNSFPSGHTCAAFACCLTWARFAARRWGRVLCLALAVLMGLPGCMWGSISPATSLPAAPWAVSAPSWPGPSSGRPKV